jgi:glutamate racemase
MDQRPIGVFDSGSGGLTAVREIRSILPSENIIYFGDTSRVPYGGRSAEILLRYARQDVHFLRSFDVKALLVACGTVSTNALPVLAAENDIPVLGVVKPSCAAAAAATRNKRVGLIATVEKGGAKYLELVPAQGKKNLADAPILKCLEGM